MPKRRPKAGERGEETGRIRPLHGGRHSLSPGAVAYSQRERLLAAVAEVVAEHGYNKATIAQITDAASVSRRTFYEHFAGKEECFIAAFDAVDAYSAESMFEAGGAQAEWPDQVAAALADFLRFLAGRPQLARLYLVEAAAVGEGMADRIERLPERYMAPLKFGRSQRSGERELPEGMEEALVGGTMILLTRRIAAGEAEQLARFIPAVIEFILAPYLGAEAAREVAARHS